MIQRIYMFIQQVKISWKLHMLMLIQYYICIYDKFETSFSLVCVFWCLYIWLLSVKLFRQWSHENGFSPVCVLKCFIRLPLSAKYFPQLSHSNGFSLVCVLWCHNNDYCQQTSFHYYDMKMVSNQYLVIWYREDMFLFIQIFRCSYNLIYFSRKYPLGWVRG